MLDCAIGLYRKHNSNDAVLKLVGRDFGDAEYNLEWDADQFMWKRKEDGKKTAKETRPSSILDRAHVGEIIEVLDALGSCTLARLASYVTIDKSNLFDLVKDLVDAGVLRRNTDGHIVTYSLTQQPAQPPAAAAQPSLLPGDSPVDTTDTTDTTPTTDTTAPRIPRHHAYHGYHAGPRAPRTFLRRARPARQHPWATAPHRNRPKPPKPPKRKKR